MTTRKTGRPRLMTGGKPITVYLPAHVREWLKGQASQKITKLVEDAMEYTEDDWQVWINESDRTEKEDRE